jgi:hypothetical protein
MRLFKSSPTFESYVRPRESGAGDDDDEVRSVISRCPDVNYNFSITAYRFCGAVSHLGSVATTVA